MAGPLPASHVSPFPDLRVEPTIQEFGIELWADDLSRFRIAATPVVFPQLFGVSSKDVGADEAIAANREEAIVLLSCLIDRKAEVVRIYPGEATVTIQFPDGEGHFEACVRALSNSDDCR